MAKFGLINSTVPKHTIGKTVIFKGLRLILKILENFLFIKHSTFLLLSILAEPASDFHVFEISLALARRRSQCYNVGNRRSSHMLPNIRKGENTYEQSDFRKHPNKAFRP